MYGEKIKAFRIMRGFTQEHMAEQLHVAQNTYSKYESNGHKLPVEVIEKIAEVLGVSVADIVSNTPIIINNQNSNLGAQGVGHIENYYTEQKELYEKVILAKDEEIETLKEIVKTLKEVIGVLKK